MNVMILAAGRGTRLGVLTDAVPKPLVDVGGKSVIERTIERLAHMGFRRIVINVHHLAEKLIARVGDGHRWGVTIAWSPEESLLNTGGGVRRALPLLGDAPFLAINGDILWDLDLTPLLRGFDHDNDDVMLGLVPNSHGHPGDFRLRPDGLLERAVATPDSLTYCGIQIIRPAAMLPYPMQPFSLNRFYDDAIADDRLRGVPLSGRWTDMGTPERLDHARLHW